MKILIDLVCPDCGHERVDVLVDRLNLPICVCGTRYERLWRLPSAIWTDDIPGGLLIEHGLCHADGSPQRFETKSAIRAEAKRRGLAAWTDYYDESRTQDGRAYLDYMKSGEYTRLKRDRAEQRAERARGRR